MALAGVELESLVSEPDALTTRQNFKSSFYVCLSLCYFATDQQGVFVYKAI